jgi:hypothetical protein
MAPEPVDLEIYQGDDFFATVTVTDSLPPDQVLQGYTASAQIRSAPQGSIILPVTAIVSTPFVYLRIPHAATVQLTRNGYWDLQIIDSSGAITTLLAGRVALIPEITR